MLGFRSRCRGPPSEAVPWTRLASAGVGRAEGFQGCRCGGGTQRQSPPGGSVERSGAGGAGGGGCDVEAKGLTSSLSEPWGGWW